MLLLINKENSSTKSLIIKALAINPELSNIQLQRILRKEFNKRISYQAIRQALQELSKSGILAREGKNYVINKLWVYKLKDFVTIIEKVIIKRSKIKVLDKQTTQIHIKNLYELGHFILFSLEQKYFNPAKKSEVFMQLNHLWIPFSDITKRDRVKEIFKRNRLKVIVKEKTLGDRMLAQWYKKYGKLKLGVDFTSPCEYIVHGDTVVEIFTSDGLKKKMGEVYRLKKVFNLFEQLSEMTYKEYGIQLVITRNAAIAKKIRKTIQASL